ncbi:MAG: hypothetical protein HY263_04300, partial [Chloroflexi bacterium]|nr:hypothetical protein [Chloroflexota bacterium]
MLRVLRESADGREAEALLEAARSTIAAERARLTGAPGMAGVVARSASELAGEALAGLERLDEGTPVPTVINATGVLIHTNLGRATWP